MAEDGGINFHSAPPPRRGAPQSLLVRLMSRARTFDPRTVGMMAIALLAACFAIATESEAPTSISRSPCLGIFVMSSRLPSVISCAS